MNELYSLLRLERERRGWSRAKVEVMTKGKVPEPTLERWEKGLSWPRNDGITLLGKLYGKSPQELGFEKSHDIMESQNNSNCVVPQEEGTPTMSDLVRRAIFGNLGSRLTGLIDLWPKRNYRYEELQSEIHKAIFDHHALADSRAETSRRDALKTMALVPFQLVGGVAAIEAGKIQKTDNDLLLKHCAVGITACWYLRRGKDHAFISDVISLYISFLQPLIYSHSETYRKASARLLAQSFMLKSNLARGLQDDDQAIAYEEEAIRYALMSDSITEQAIANRELAIVYWRDKKYKQALPHAQYAYGLARSNENTPKIVLSLTASGLSLCQAANGHSNAAKISLKEARDLFDPRDLIASISYSESILTLGAGQIYQQIGDWDESINLHAKSLTIADISAMGIVECRINYAKTEVSRDDQPRKMDLCIKLLTEAITGAKELHSKRYQRDAREVYDLLRIAWPREDAIKKLGRDHFGL